MYFIERNMEKRGQRKIIFIMLIVLIFFSIILVLFYFIENNETKMSDNEVRDIIGKMTDDEILAVHYYDKCVLQDKEYEKVYIVITKLGEKFVHDMMGEFEYKYYFLDKGGNIFSEQYNFDDKRGLCKEVK